MRLKEFFRLSELPVFIASLCCLAPIVLVLLGLSSLSFAISLTETLDGKYQWAFILAGVLALGVSLFFYFRKQGVCTLDQAVKHRNEIINKIALILVISILSYIVFFYGILNLIGRLLHLW